ncbi:hypothetical protein SAMN05428642_104277 [Flaviramulus basaltis]|uniref:Uncharacterized protein n=1 Tax=Flaviramulus basaltis TaxID=369401 RepID=A0A1K2IQA4_9FLAO|nr:hypothetical protein SAMN05428642_104277 [Flaviramulus basaltis]
MHFILLVYDPTFDEWLTLGGGVFIILLLAF